MLFLFYFSYLYASQDTPLSCNYYFAELISLMVIYDTHASYSSFVFSANCALRYLVYNLSRSIAKAVEKAVCRGIIIYIAIIHL